MNECPICYEPISSDVNKVVTECGHAFHCKCLMMNASINGFSCPCCRSEMTKKNVKTNRSRIQEPSPDMQVDTNTLQRGYRVSTRINVVEEYEDDDEDEEDEVLEIGDQIEDDVIAVASLPTMMHASQFEHEMHRIRRNDCFANVHYTFASFRMFMQRVEGDEVEEEGFFQAEERERHKNVDEEDKKRFNVVLDAVNKRGLTKEDLVAALMHEWLYPTNKKTCGKVKGAIIAAREQLNQPQNQV